MAERQPTLTRPLSDSDRLRKALLTTAKYIDATVTKSDPLLIELEAAFAGGSAERMAEAAYSIVGRAHAIREGHLA